MCGGPHLFSSLGRGLPSSAGITPHALMCHKAKLAGPHSSLGQLTRSGEGLG